jgi:hypothetical protein
MGKPLASLLTTLLLLVSLLSFGQIHTAVSHPVVEAHTTYYVRAYVTTNEGILYGNEKSFTASVRCIKNETVTKSSEK